MWLLDKMLHRLVRGCELVLINADGKRYTYGTPVDGQDPVIVRLADDKVARDIARSPRLGTAEAFMDGRLIIENSDILGLLSLIRGGNVWEDGASGLEGPLWRRALSSFSTWLDRFNWESRSKRNVAHHYDLDDRLYSLFLDEDRQYSCGYFIDPDESLARAQLDKKTHIAAKLALKPGQRVLDIGCGWGGMALYLNRVADVDVLGVTLSEEQLKVARRRAEEAGVADRVRFELVDYRAVQGEFDRIVSVGMFEHVGPPQFTTFFRKCHSLLAPDGVMLLHTIGRMGGPGTTDAFTRKYIFPGGYIPALSETVAASEKAKLMVTDVEVLRLHYAYTLEHWYRNTVAQRERIEQIFDARFYRLWCFYLAGALCSFRFGGMCNFQIQYTRDRYAVPLVRDYMMLDEQRLRAEADVRQRPPVLA